jgi:hypothetical protein
MLGGGTVDGRLNDTYLGAYNLFPGCSAVGGLDATARELRLGPAFAGGLSYTRRVYVPASGKFARYLDILTNTSPVALGIPSLSGSLGSQANTRVVVSPATTNRTYAVTDSGGRCCESTLAHVFAGAGARAPATAEFSDGTDFAGYRWNYMIPPGQTVILMHFTAQRDSNNAAGAIAQAVALATLTDPDALSGMSTEERSRVINFNVP